MLIAPLQATQLTSDTSPSSTEALVLAAAALTGVDGHLQLPSIENPRRGVGAGPEGASASSHASSDAAALLGKGLAGAEALRRAGAAEVLVLDL